MCSLSLTVRMGVVTNPAEAKEIADNFHKLGMNVDVPEIEQIINQ